MSIRINCVTVTLAASSLVGCASTVSNSAQEAAVIQAGLAAASRAKVYVVEKFASTGVWADSHAAAGYDVQTEGPALIKIGPGGVVTVFYTQGVGKEIVLTPHERANGRIDWTCVSHGIAPNTLPEGCM